MDARDMAPHYLVTGGVPLHGEVTVSGAKNAVTKMLIASLLTKEPCVLRNVPLLGDLDLTVRLCQDMGSRTQLVDHTLAIHTPYIEKTVVSTRVGGLNRIAVLTIGTLLHRCGEAMIPKPGGDRIGPRPIDYHIEGLCKMGANIVEREGHYHCSITERLQGVTIKLLQKMGAIIEIKVDRRIVIDGVDKLHGASHTLLSDRNEAVSLAIATYLTRGDVYLHGAQQDTLLTFLNTLSKMGLGFEIDDGGIRFIGANSAPPAIALETDVHPGFMTDWQQPFVVLLTQAEGMSVVHETIYEDRFGYTSALESIGAHVGLYPKCLGEVPCRFREKQYMHSCVVRGPTPLKGARLDIPDIRAGCSYILAALCAEGTSEIYGIEHIERGYEHLDEKLRALGAQMERVVGE